MQVVLKGFESFLQSGNFQVNNNVKLQQQIQLQIN